MTLWLVDPNTRRSDVMQGTVIGVAASTGVTVGLTLGLLGALEASRVEPGFALPARVVEVTDGDTLTVEFVPQTARIRLIDCWAPELRSENAAERRKAQAAKEHLERLAKGKECTVIVPWRRDVGQMTTLGRVLGRVVLDDGTDLSRAQVEGGFARRE